MRQFLPAACCRFFFIFLGTLAVAIGKVLIIASVLMKVADADCSNLPTRMILVVFTQDFHWHCIFCEHCSCATSGPEMCPCCLEY